MGLFCVSFHVRTADEKAVSAALKARGGHHRVLAPKGGWVSAYDERASRQDETRIRELAESLSQDLMAAAIAFLVHDSDIACYWLFDRGRLLDEYNSCPDYFDDDAKDQASGAAGGQPDVLVRYCRADVSTDNLAEILTQQAVFADDLVAELAQALGIDPERALSDYRDLADGGGPGGFGGPSGPGGDDDDDDGGLGGGWDGGDDAPHVLRFPTQLASQLAQQLGADRCSADADPLALALVEAAAAGDVGQIGRLVEAGAAIDAEAPAPLPAGQPAAGLGKLFPGGLPQFSMTPLLAAIMHERPAAAHRLLDAGADPNRTHPLWGTPVHAATAAGNVELLRLLLDRGGKASVCNRQGQTPLAVLVASRATIGRLNQAKAMVRSLGMKLPGILEDVSPAGLPTAGWEACEKLLLARGAI